jgi:hypothetical protein
MASELRVNTLKDASGNNSVGVSSVAKGTKVLHVADQTGTQATLSSFNISSIADFATGGSTSSYTNNMSDGNYVFNLSRDRTSAQNGGVVQTSTTSAPSSSSISFNCFGENFSGQDVDRACLSIQGDLA